MTYTYVLMEVSQEAHEEIKKKLLDAGYNQAIHDDEGGALDMHGIALIPAPLVNGHKPTCFSQKKPRPSWEGTELTEEECCDCGAVGSE